jgi:hypothetical protein
MLVEVPVEESYQEQMSPQEETQQSWFFAAIDAKRNILDWQVEVPPLVLRSLVEVEVEVPPLVLRALVEVEVPVEDTYMEHMSPQAEQAEVPPLACLVQSPQAEQAEVPPLACSRLAIEAEVQVEVPPLACLVQSPQAEQVEAEVQVLAHGEVQVEVTGEDLF